MFGRGSGQTTQIDILIGRTARVQGDVDFTGGLHVDGHITGNVRADVPSGSTLSVSESGRIEGSVSVPTVLLNGVVSGDIHATERVALGAHARVQGDVYYGIIEISAGAEITGNLVPLAEHRAEGEAKLVPDPGEG